MNVIWLVLGIVNFVIFACDLEYDRDVITWLWLLNSILCFIIYIKDEIVNRIKKEIK
jgi:hypothetical protein